MSLTFAGWRERTGDDDDPFRNLARERGLSSGAGCPVNSAVRCARRIAREPLGTCGVGTAVAFLTMRPADIVAPPTAAAALASRMLKDVGSRLAHSRRVAEQASVVRSLLGDPWRSSLVDAAWLHDIGYSERARSTGFHPLDGARWLRDRRWPAAVCRLVAWHTRAGTEAQLRGLERELGAEFEPPPPEAQAALTWADLTSSPDGEQCTAAFRIEEILSRYGDASLVHRATTANAAELMADARSIDRQILVVRGRC